MAKKFDNKDKTYKNDFPSECGSHASMIDEEKTAALDNEDWVVCIGERGPYATEKRKLDNGMSDPNRWDIPNG